MNKLLLPALMLSVSLLAGTALADLEGSKPTPTVAAPTAAKAVPSGPKTSPAQDMQLMISKGCVPYIAAGMPEKILVESQKLVPVEKKFEQEFLHGKPGKAYVAAHLTNEPAIILTNNGAACTVMVRQIKKADAQAELKKLLNGSKPPFKVSEPMQKHKFLETTGYETKVGNGKIGVVTSLTDEAKAPYQAMVTIFKKG